jgi:rhamnosyltransferase
VNSIALTDARILIPVRNGGERWREAAAALRRCVLCPESVIVIDSDSTDGSGQVAREHGFTVERIDVRDFNHGRTRQEAVAKHCGNVPFAILLTQDAVLESDRSLTEILAAFGDPGVGAAYGRQLPHPGAHPVAAYANLVNYPPESSTRSVEDSAYLGMKVAYLSNSFAAYRVAALQQCGGFPSHLILGEDTYVAMRMLLSGWRVRYCAHARVFHSHNYTLVEEMERFFDYGVLHAQCPGILTRFGAAEATGLKLLRSEVRYMGRRAPWLLPQVAVRSCLKFVGYRLGRSYNRLPVSLCRRLSMTKGYWNSSAVSQPS